MIRKIIPIIFAILFFEISICFARFNYPHVLRKTFNDFERTKNIQKVIVPISPLPGDKNNYTTVFVDNYIKGVVYKELYDWSGDTAYIQGLAALAVAAKSKLGNLIYKYDTVKMEYINDSTVKVINNQDLQVYEYKDNYSVAIDSAVALAEGKILAYYEGDGRTLIPLDAMYAGKFEEPFTRDSEKCVNSKGSKLNYQPYLRSVENYEVDIGGNPTLTWQKCGMSQTGALSYALEGINYETILDHYYGPTPPAVTWVCLLKVEGDSGVIIYEAKNDTTLETDTTREIKIFENHYLAGLKKDLGIEVGFDEVVGSDFEPTASADSIQAWLVGNNVSKEFNEGKKFRRIENLNKPIKNVWVAILPKENLTDLTEGTYSIKISASHFHGGYLLDSTLIDKAYKRNFNTEHSQYDSGSDNIHEVKIDLYPPTVTNFYPPQNAYLNKPFPIFTAIIIDSFSGIDTTSLKVEINGREYSYADGMSYDTSSGRITYTPQIPLSEGIYQWRIRGRDNAK